MTSAKGSVKPEGKEVAISESRPSDSQLQALETMGDIIGVMGSDAIDSTKLGSGFTVLDKREKDRLVGVPCLFLFWEEHAGDFGPFISAHVVTYDSSGLITGKYIVNDGSTGIAEQLTSLGTDKRNLRAAHGLRRSDYDYPDPATGEMKAASTYYIDTSA